MKKFIIASAIIFYTGIATTSFAAANTRVKEKNTLGTADRAGEKNILGTADRL
ncbi:MAG TPA: hypothetical protein VIQ77_06060 [Mucilaginibacter sp.]